MSYSMEPVYTPSQRALPTRELRRTFAWCFDCSCVPLLPFASHCSAPRTVAECIQRQSLPLHLVYTGECPRPFTFGSTTAARRRRAPRCSGESHEASRGRQRGWRERDAITAPQTAPHL